MAVSALDSRIFRNIFCTAEIRKVFSDVAYAQCMIDAETALARAQSKLQVIPNGAGTAITAACSNGAEKLEYVSTFSIVDMCAILTCFCLSFDRLERETEIVGYPVLPLLRQLNEMCLDNFGKYIHWGATTQDIMDIASILQIRSGLKIVRRELESLVDVLVMLSEKYRNT